MKRENKKSMGAAVVRSHWRGLCDHLKKDGWCKGWDKDQSFEIDFVHKDDGDDRSNFHRIISM